MCYYDGIETVGKHQRLALAWGLSILSHWCWHRWKHVCIIPSKHLATPTWVSVNVDWKVQPSLVKVKVKVKFMCENLKLQEFAFYCFFSSHSLTPSPGALVLLTSPGPLLQVTHTHLLGVHKISSEFPTTVISWLPHPSTHLFLSSLIQIQSNYLAHHTLLQTVVHLISIVPLCHVLLCYIEIYVQSCLSDLHACP